MGDGEASGRLRRDQLARLQSQHLSGKHFSSLSCQILSIPHRHFTQVGGFDASKYATTYPNIKFQLILARRVEGSIISTLVPSFLFLAIAYLAFFIPKDAMAVRLTMLLFMLLNM